MRRPITSMRLPPECHLEPRQYPRPAQVHQPVGGVPLAGERDLFAVRRGGRGDGNAAFARGRFVSELGRLGHVSLERSAWYADSDQTQNYYLRDVRSGCLNSLLAADGLVNVQNFNADCVCNFPLQTSFALAPMPDCAAWAGTAPLPVAPPPAQPRAGSAPAARLIATAMHILAAYKHQGSVAARAKCDCPRSARPRRREFDKRHRRAIRERSVFPKQRGLRWPIAECSRLGILHGKELW